MHATGFKTIPYCMFPAETQTFMITDLQIDGVTHKSVCILRYIVSQINIFTAYRKLKSGYETSYPLHHLTMDKKKIVEEV